MLTATFYNIRGDKSKPPFIPPLKGWAFPAALDNWVYKTRSSGEVRRNKEAPNERALRQGETLSPSRPLPGQGQQRIRL